MSRRRRTVPSTTAFETRSPPGLFVAMFAPPARASPRGVFRPVTRGVGARDVYGRTVRRVDFPLRDDVHDRGGHPNRVASPPRRRVGIPRVVRARSLRGVGAGGTNDRIDMGGAKRRRRRRRRRRAVAGLHPPRLTHVADVSFSSEMASLREALGATPRVGRRRILASVPGGRVGDDAVPDAIGGGGAARRLRSTEGRV